MPIVVLVAILLKCSFPWDAVRHWPFQLKDSLLKAILCDDVENGFGSKTAIASLTHVGENMDAKCHGFQYKI